MSEPKDNLGLADLIERRDEVLRKLREREPEVVERLIFLNGAIYGAQAESARMVRPDEYAGIHKPSDALFSYLDKMKTPQIREEMCQALVDGGYTDKTEDPYWSLIRATYYQVRKKRLVERSGLLGKSEWPKELFVAKKEAAAPKD